MFGHCISFCLNNISLCMIFSFKNSKFYISVSIRPFKCSILYDTGFVKPYYAVFSFLCWSLILGSGIHTFSARLTPCEYKSTYFRMVVSKISRMWDANIRDNVMRNGTDVSEITTRADIVVCRFTNRPHVSTFVTLRLIILFMT